MAASKSFKFKSKLTDNANNGGYANVQMNAPLKYLSAFWSTIEMQLINCKTNLILTWSANCFVCESDRETIFGKINAKLRGPVATLSTRGNRKLSEQLK